MRHVSASRSKLLSAFFKHGQKSLSAVQWTNTRGPTHGRLEERWGLLCLLSRRTVWVENGLRVLLYRNPDVLVNGHLAIIKDCELLGNTVSACNLLPAWSSLSLEKLTVSHLVKFLALYGTRGFITALTTARQLSILSWARPIHSMLPHPTSRKFISMLSLHLRLGLPSGLFPSGFPTKILYAPLPPHTCYMSRPSHSSRFHHPNNIWWCVQIIKLLIV